MMTTILGMLHQSLLGLPAWGWMLIVVVIAVEGRLGRSKNPKFRSIADASHSFLGVLLKPTIGRVPGLGPLVVAILDALDPTPDETALAVAPVPAETPAAPTSEEITHPEPVPPPKPKKPRR
jgi:hypothetical protein